MSMETISTKRRRVYPRKFPHEEAVARHKAGETVASLARGYGVSDAGIRRVVDPKQRERMRLHSVKWQMQGVCHQCDKEGISRGSRYCRSCSLKLRTRSVRPETLHCSGCHLWLPDKDFAPSSQMAYRRYRRRDCRSCATKARTAYRAKHRVLCEGGCGKMVEGKGRAARGDPNRPFLCNECARARNTPWMGYWPNLVLDTMKQKKEEIDG